MVELEYANDKSVILSSGNNRFGIAFYRVPRVSDKTERSIQRVHTPLTNPDGCPTRGSSLHGFPFTIYKDDVGSHYLAIEDEKAFAIRMFSGSEDMMSTFKVKVGIGGVNVLQHTTNDRKYQTQDYFVVSEQKWVWGKQVNETTARQFRVFGHSKASLSARAQLKGDNLVKEVEIEIIPREQRPRTPPSLVRYRQRSRSPTDVIPNRRSRSESPAATLVHTDTDTQLSIFNSNNFNARSSSTRPTTRQGSSSTLDVTTEVSVTSSSTTYTKASSQGCSCHHHHHHHHPKDDRPADLESIHSTPEPGAADDTRQMVIGTGGLIRQIVEKYQHPDWIDCPDGSITLKFKIFDPDSFYEATNIPLGDPGGNYKDLVANPPDKCFKSHRPIIEHPERLREDLLSPMELESLGKSEEEDDLAAFMRLRGEAMNQPRNEPPAQVMAGLMAGLMAEKPRKPGPETETESQKEEEKKPMELEPKPILRQPKSLPVPAPVDKPGRQERSNRRNTEPPFSRSKGTPRSSTPRTERSATGMTTRKDSTEKESPIRKRKWKEKWGRFITFMKRALSPCM